jgi:hypothetical protein
MQQAPEGRLVFAGKALAWLDGPVPEGVSRDVMPVYVTAAYWAVDALTGMPVGATTFPELHSGRCIRVEWRGEGRALVTVPGPDERSCFRLRRNDEAVGDEDPISDLELEWAPASDDPIEKLTGLSPGLVAKLHGMTTPVKTIAELRNRSEGELRDGSIMGPERSKIAAALDVWGWTLKR